MDLTYAPEFAVAHLDPMTIHIRPADLLDAGLLADLGASTFLATYADDVPFRPLATFVESFFSPVRMRAELDEQGTRAWIAEIDGIAVGYLVCAADPAPVPTPQETPMAVRRLYLTAAAQGRGIGRRLMETASAHARRSDHDGLWLTVWEANTRAREAYTAWGFRPAGSVPFEFAGIHHTDLILSVTNIGDRHRSADDLRHAS